MKKIISKNLLNIRFVFSLTLTLLSCKESINTNKNRVQKISKTNIENARTQVSKNDIEKDYLNYSIKKFIAKEIYNKNELFIYNLITSKKDTITLFLDEPNTSAYLKYQNSYVKSGLNFYYDSDVKDAIDALAIFENVSQDSFILSANCSASDFVIYELTKFKKDSKNIYKGHFKLNAFNYDGNFNNENNILKESGDSVYNELYKIKLKLSIPDNKLDYENIPVIKTYLNILKGEKNNVLKIDSTVYAQVKSYLNIRSAPNSNGEIIAKAYPKDGLKVLEVLDGWVKIELNGTEGYVSKDYVK